MDDYPRSPIPSVDEYHVDLFSWIAKSTALMARLERSLTDYYTTLSTDDSHVGRKNNDKDNDDSNINKKNKLQRNTVMDKMNKAIVKHDFQDKFKSLSEYLAPRLDSLHWSEVHKGKSFLNLKYIIKIILIILLLITVQSVAMLVS